MRKKIQFWIELAGIGKLTSIKLIASPVKHKQVLMYYRLAKTLNQQHFVVLFV